ncbi:MAG: urea ABC transporter substrate-binding protein [Anaerolineae bacterium]|nr:urea ABC transporter substrate-binding protein [Anaerolineae bacterium]
MLPRSLQIGLFLLVVALLLAVVQRQSASPPRVKVGVLHSLTGTMAISEAAVVEATLLAIDEINAAGGLPGGLIEPIVVDGQSDPAIFAREARRLITRDEVNVIFGCWTSACRKTVKPVFEELNHLLIYPVQYEGLEESPNIVYTGAAPNQQIIPAVKWALDNLGSRVFLVGSDYVFPRTANAIIRDQVTALNGTILGEEYLLIGSQAVEEVIQAIVTTQPDVILNTINGDSNIAFFRALRAAGITPDDIPVISFSVSENELVGIDVSLLVGDYAAWNYFQSLPTPENAAFVQRFQARYGAERVIGDPMEAAYVGVYLWAQAVRQAGTAAVNDVRTAMLDQSLSAPAGIVYVDALTRHTWKTVYIGQIRPDGQFDVVWTSGAPVRPQPYPGFRDVFEWERFLEALYTGWGNQWANPG